MAETIAISLLSAAFAAVAAYAAARAKAARERKPLDEKIKALEIENVRAAEALSSERKRAEDSARHHAELQSAAETRFKELAQKILEERSEKFGKEGTDRIRGLVEPLARDIKAFREKLAASDVATAERTAQMKAEIENLVAQTNAVSMQANSLAEALRGDAQFSGSWGEIQLKRVLEACGMTENIHYTYQETFREDGKIKRTDVIVKLPDGRSLVIDAKATVAAAVDYHSATTPEEKSAAIARTVESVRRHVDEIAAAGYQNAVPGAFPGVLMYIPLEEVYLLAMKALVQTGGEKELLREYARRRNVVFVNSASVVPVVKLVETMWRADKSEKNAKDMAKAAGELLRRANEFLATFEKVGAAIDSLKAEYSAAGRLISDAPGGQSIAKAAARLIQLGAKAETRSGKKMEVARALAAGVESAESPA